MPVKKFVQSGTFSMLVLLPAIIFCIALLFFIGFDEPVPIIILSFVILTLIVCLLIFFKLTITIDDTHLTFILGIGLVRKRYPLSDIESCTSVRNSPLWGMGIHMNSSGWLYNVSGKHAIELSFKSRKPKIRIGTDKPDEVAHAVNEKIDGRMAGSAYEKSGNYGIYLILALLAAAIIVPVILIVYGSKETEVSFSDSAMTLSGMYGLTIGYTDIIQADTLLRLPGIKIRTDGFATGKILRGNFKLDDKSKVMLFIKKGVPPYILLKTKSTTIYLNFDNPLRTREVFKTVSDKLD
jgi:hypothetical protein